MPQHEPHQEIKKYRDTPMKFRYITPLVVAAGAAAAIIAAPAAMAADTGDQSCSAAPGVIDSVCVTTEMLRSTTPHRFSSVRPRKRRSGARCRNQQGGGPADQQLACPAPQGTAAVERADCRAHAEQGQAGRHDRDDQSGPAGAEKVGQHDDEGAQREREQARERCRPR